jgi:adenine-specific DNA-methyltransferase
MSETDDTRMPLTSADVLGERMERLRELIPEAFVEGKVDFDRLKAALGELVDEGRERYGLSWAGKADAIRNIQTPSVGTLVPCPEESVNFDTSENLFIEGDNLEVLKLLQKSYYGKVKMIYIDPPYNKDKDFIYPDRYREGLEGYLQYTGQATENGTRLTTTLDTSGRHHSKWLRMLYPRLFLARNLLRQDGLIFVSIDDTEMHNLRQLLDEVFGEENFVAAFVWNTEGHTDNQFDVKVTHEYVLLYARNWSQTALGHVVDPNTREQSNLWKGFAENSITKNGPGNPPSDVDLPIGFPCLTDTLDLPTSDVPADFYKKVEERGYITRDITDTFNVEYPVRKQPMTVRAGKLLKPCTVFTGWANVNKLRAFIDNGCEPLQEENGTTLRFYLSARGVVYYRRDREMARNILSVLRSMGTTERMRSEIEHLGIKFQYPKPKELLKYLIQVGTHHSGVVLDFFAGSGTIGQAVLELNREQGGRRTFILVQLPEELEESQELDDGRLLKTIADVCRERVRRVIGRITSQDDGKIDFEGDEPPDCGCKVFRLAASNFKIWDGEGAPTDADALAGQLRLFADHVMPDRGEQDILYELMLKAGLPLTAEIEEKDVAGQTAYSIADGLLLICLADPITQETLRAMAELNPQRIVCLDPAFGGNDQLKTNTVLEMKSHGIEFRTV